MMSRILAVITAFAAVGSGVLYYSDTVSAEEVTLNGIVYEIDEEKGECTVKANNKISTEIEIPDEVNGVPVTAIGKKAFKDDKNLKSITLPDSIREIGTSAFSGCSNLQSITLPASLEILRDYAFSSCYELKTINFNDKLSRIDSCTFQLCTSIEELNIPGSIEKIPDHAFHGLHSLTKLRFGDGVAEIEANSFLNSSKIEDIYIPKSVESIGDHALGFRYFYTDPETSPYIQFENAVIHGYPNTAAQQYAEKFGFKFEMKGDADSSKSFDGNDLITLRSYLLAVSEDCSINADMDDDGVFTCFDVCLIRKQLAELTEAD